MPTNEASLVLPFSSIPFLNLLFLTKTAKNLFQAWHYTIFTPTIKYYFRAGTFMNSGNKKTTDVLRPAY